MIRSFFAAAALALSAAATPVFAGSDGHLASSAAATSGNRLMIVNGQSGRIVYDDGYNDAFCVIRRHVVGWDDYGRRIVRRRLACR